MSWVREELTRAAQEGWQERLQQALVRLPKAPAATTVPVEAEETKQGASGDAE